MDNKRCWKFESRPASHLFATLTAFFVVFAFYGWRRGDHWLAVGFFGAAMLNAIRFIMARRGASRGLPPQVPEKSQSFQHGTRN
jgi:hypothetical protein